MIRSVFLASVAVLALISPAFALQAGPTLRASEAPVEPRPFILHEHRIVAAPDASGADRRPRGRPAGAEAGSGPSGRPHYLVFVRAAELRHALPPGLLDALVSVESAYERRAVSQVGAMGLTQLMPATARMLEINDPFDVQARIERIVDLEHAGHGTHARDQRSVRCAPWPA